MRTLPKFFARTFCYIFALSIILLSCTGQNKYVRHPNNIYKIVFAQGGCYFDCPSESVSIDSSLQIMYRGVEFVDRVGYFQGSISAESWDSIQTLCLPNHGWKSDSCMGIDSQILEIHIYSENGVQHFWGSERCLPQPIVDLCTSVEKLIKNTLMVESHEFSLETNAHLPPPVNDTIIIITDEE